MTVRSAPTRGEAPPGWHRRAWPLVGVAALASLLGLTTACGSSNAAGNGGGGDTLTVIDTGFGASSNGEIAAVVIVKNESTVDGATHVTVQYTVYDASDHVLGTDSILVPAIRVGEKQAITDNISLSGGVQAQRVKAQVAVGAWQSDPHPTAVITSRGVQFAHDSTSSPMVNGELVSHYRADLKQVRASGVCYDSGHKIVGGGFTYVDFLPGGGTTGASMSADVSVTPATCEIYATLSGSSG